MVPFDTESPFVTSGIRIGAPALTTRGFEEEQFMEVVELIDTVLKSPENESVLSDVKKKVKDLCMEFPLYDFVSA